ncbi:tetratricopeptide repeat protein [Actinoplanes sp. TBRC 11911]|uniref:FxSxx-COOH system tetratricopeptide repeat protein n=1 Tax=Actinoplanes sp. TBRC 11911 TaxID=2729386 RepID=UPI00145E2571|nr:FxSxx-COOH system tetratricopeptide repeat protein [Actinoplanes sp. TBRC 11911]NMO49792.1 tetratricopeptide repeat protein [Actinoplanes sp. TBRC 11911]
MDLPFINALSDRRMLLNLVRQGVVRFPDVEEKPEARLHVVSIVMTCMSHPGGLRALRSALDTMAPDSDGTRQAHRLIQSATLAALIPDGERDRVKPLLQRHWTTFVAAAGGMQAPTNGDLVGRFEALTQEPLPEFGLPAALAFVEEIAALAPSARSTPLSDWVDQQAERLELTLELQKHRSHESPGGLRPPGSDTPETEQITKNKDIVSENGLGWGREISATWVDAEVIDDHDNLPPGPEHQREQDEEERGHQGDEMPSLTSAAPREVESLPQVWGNVPPRNPNFTGRVDLLEALHEQFSTERETAVLPESLHGMGGVGKSQVAIEYIHKHRSEYDLIWWIPAEHKSQILSALTELAQRLGLDLSREAISAVPAVREALSTAETPYANWFLVFDNAESLSDVRPFFPTGGHGKILVTSRNAEWAAVTRTLEVDVFSRPESTAFLRKRTPELALADADRLAEALGDLPLAVEQAAAWRVATGMPVDQYLELLNEKRIELLELGTSPDYEVSVAAAWNVSLDKLEEVNGAALQLLQVCSFFAPEPISRDLFAGSPSAQITETLDETLRDPIKLARAIRDIQRYALAKFDHRAGTLQMHRLVQAVLVSRMTSDHEQIMRHGSHALLANGDVNKPSVPDSWPRYQALLPHLTVSGAVGSADPRVQQFVFNMVKFLYYWGDHDGCLSLATKVHEERKKDRGEDNEHTLSVAKWRAWILWVLGHFREAADINRRCLELSESTVGAADEGTLDSMTRVALDLRTAGDATAALELDRRAFERCAREFGEDDPATLNAAMHLGMCLKFNGAFNEALRLDSDTYRRSVAVLGENTDDTLRVLNYLTIGQREAGDYLGAHKRQEAVYQTFINVYGMENPAVTRAARNLAVARRRAGDHDGALALSSDTLRRFSNRYGDNYPETMAAALDLAIDLRHSADLPGALKLGAETLDRYVKVFGERHPHTLAARANLAIVMRLMGEPDAAHASNAGTLKVLDETLGLEHPIAIVCAINLGSDLAAQGKAREAYERDIDSLDRCRRVFAENHPSTLACSLNLAIDLGRLDRIAEADKIHADTLDRYRRVLGGKHPATLNALQSVRADCDIDPSPL